MGAKVSKETAKTGSQWSAKYSANGEYGLAGSQLAVSQQPVQQSERQSVHAPIAISSVRNGCNRTKARLDGFALVGLMDCHDQALTVGHALGVAGCSLTVAVTGALPINGCAGTCTCHQPVGKHVDVEVPLVGLEPRRSSSVCTIIVSSCACVLGVPPYEVRSTLRSAPRPTIYMSGLQRPGVVPVLPYMPFCFVLPGP